MTNAIVDDSRRANSVLRMGHRAHKKRWCHWAPRSHVYNPLHGVYLKEDCRHGARHETGPDKSPMGLSAAAAGLLDLGRE